MPAAEQVSSARMVMAMAGIGILSGILLVATYIGTLPAIERNKAAALERAIFDVIPGGASKVSFARDGEQLRPLAEGEAAAVRYHAAYDEDGALAGVAIEAQRLVERDVGVVHDEVGGDENTAAAVAGVGRQHDAQSALAHHVPQPGGAVRGVARVAVDVQDRRGPAGIGSGDRPVP